jgi:hypothetical protein
MEQRSSTLRLAVVRGLDTACGLIDDVAYRPAVVKLTAALPWFWCCHLARLSQKLDERWQTGYWDGPDAPPVPNGPCEACGRRASWLVMGGLYLEEPEIFEPGEEPDFMDTRPAYLCSWCKPDGDPSNRPRDAEELRRLLDDAGNRSIAWRWRWRVG